MTFIVIIFYSIKYKDKQNIPSCSGGFDHLVLADVSAGFPLAVMMLARLKMSMQALTIERQR